jgi:hypothetical protein
MSFARAYASVHEDDVLPSPTAIVCQYIEVWKEIQNSRLGYTGGLNPYRGTSDSFVYPCENATFGYRARPNASASKYFIIADSPNPKSAES